MQIKHHFEAPCKYVKKDNKYIPVYPGAIRDYKIGFEYASIDSAMKNISIGYPDKGDIRITSIMLSMYVFERNLAAYYTSTNGYFGNYSVRLDQNTFNNINGGYGVFGASYYTDRFYTVHKAYCQTFGYRSIYD